MKKYDLAVIGGGFAGTAAAIAAAREGASVILIEKSNCLGGAPCNCLVQPFMPYWTSIDGKKIMLSRGIFEQITSSMKQLETEIDGRVFPENHIMCSFQEEYLKVVLNRMAIEAGVELLFHARLTGCESSGGKIESVTITSKLGSFKVCANYFIDATGDADLAYMGGFSVRLGREEDGLCQPMTLCFRLSGVDTEKYHSLPKNYINDIYKKFQSEGKIKNIREDVLIFNNPIDGVLHFNSTRIVKLNPTDPFDLTKAETEAREQAMELFMFMKNNIPGFENCRLLMTAPEIGVRESRMIDGEHLLTGEELKALTKFDDSIALGNYDIDIHNPEGSGTSHYYFKDGEFYTIPYKALIPKGAKNLLAAGRCISADHNAQASIRIMPIVCCIGEAAGTACALAAKEKVSVQNVNIKKLRDTLEGNGAVTEL